MAFYGKLFDAIGLRDWSDANPKGGPISMAQLLAQVDGDQVDANAEMLPFPSLDNLHDGRIEISQTRDMTTAVEDMFLSMRDGLKLVLDPLTQPLSWALDGTLYLFAAPPWWVLVPLLVAQVWAVSRSLAVTVFVAFSFLFLGFFDHLDVALETLSIICLYRALRGVWRANRCAHV